MFIIFLIFLSFFFLSLRFYSLFFLFLLILYLFFLHYRFFQFQFYYVLVSFCFFSFFSLFFFLFLSFIPSNFFYQIFFISISALISSLFFVLNYILFFFFFFFLFFFLSFFFFFFPSFFQRLLIMSIYTVSSFLFHSFSFLVQCRKKEQYINITIQLSRGVMVKAMHCGIVVRGFVLQSRCYVHFRANTLGKGMNPLILPPAMGK